METDPPETPEPILELDGVRFDSFSPRVDLSIGQGQLAFMRSRLVSPWLLGLRKPLEGEIRFQGKPWDERNVTMLENDRRKIGTVWDARSRRVSAWVANLDVDENVFLAADFDSSRRHRSIIEEARELAEQFGFENGPPSIRAAQASAADLIRSQWIRAFLVRPMEFLILDNPIEDAPSASIPELVEKVKEALDKGVAVLWAAEYNPPFSELDLSPDFLLT
ncbi:MAG: hypothetical protein HKN23_02575 [Verrucomicrobiales bacterium]|nr:hypothetical protein [Verrucomicrobiales bacterium]